MPPLPLRLLQVLDGSESQYSGMQIGTLQDEEDDGAPPSSEERPEPFSQSALGMLYPLDQLSIHRLLVLYAARFALQNMSVFLIN